MKKLFLPIFLILASPFIFSQEATSQEAEEAVNQFLRLQFALERPSYEIIEVQKINKCEYLVQVSFKVFFSPSFAVKMFEYIGIYVNSLATEENIAKFQSFTTIEEELDFLMELMGEGAREFQKLPLKTTDFINSIYTFKVTKVKVGEKNKFRIVFTSEEDLANFYETFLD